MRNISRFSDQGVDAWNSWRQEIYPEKTPDLTPLENGQRIAFEEGKIRADVRLGIANLLNVDLRGI